MTSPPQQPGNGSITITLRDVWTELRLVSAKVDQVERSVGEVDRKVSDVSTDNHDHELRLRAIEQVVQTGLDHGVRIAALEKGRWPLPSLAVLVSICAIIVSVLVAYRR